MDSGRIRKSVLGEANIRLPDAYRQNLLFSGIGLALVGAAAAGNSGLPALPQSHNQAFSQPGFHHAKWIPGASGSLKLAKRYELGLFEYPAK